MPFHKPTMQYRTWVSELSGRFHPVLLHLPLRTVLTCIACRTTADYGAALPWAPQGPPSEPHLNEAPASPPRCALRLVATELLLYKTILGHMKGNYSHGFPGKAG